MTRASMVEVMTQQYIRTARLKGLSFGSVVVKHALRNALIAPFTVIMLQFPWLLTGVVIVEAMFRYQGFGFTLVEAAGNNDIDLLLGCSLVSVFVVLHHAADLRCRLRLSQSAHPSAVEARADADRICRRLPGRPRHAGAASGRSGWRWRSCWAPASPSARGSASTASCSTAASASPASASASSGCSPRSSPRPVAPFDPLGQVPIMKDALPGAIDPDSGMALSVRRRQAGARRVQPHGLRQPDRADHRAGGDRVRADGRHHARPAGRLLRRPDRHRPVLPGQSGAGLPGHPAVLPAGDAGHHGHADPLRAWPGCSSCSRSSSSPRCSRRGSRTGRTGSTAARPDAA